MLTKEQFEMIQNLGLVDAIMEIRATLCVIQ